MGIFDGGKRIGHTRTGCHYRHARHAGQSGHGVGREYRCHLVTHIDHPNATPFAPDENRRNVPPAQGEDEYNALRFEDVRNYIAAVHLKSSLTLSKNR